MADEWAVRQPHPALRQLITRYIGYRQRDLSLRVHRGLPSRHATLIISLEQPVRTAWTSGESLSGSACHLLSENSGPRSSRQGFDSQQLSGSVARRPAASTAGLRRPSSTAHDDLESHDSPMACQALVGGMHVAPVLIAQDRSQTGLHLELNPFGIRALLGLPAAELSGRVVDLAEFGSRRLVSLPDRLAATGSWERRFAILDDVFLAHLAEVAPAAAPAPEIGEAWRRLIVAGGGIRVGALAGEVGWSRRHLADRFGRELGLTPKQVARVLRFERAGALLRQHGPMDLAGVAVACGYYDQAHLSNEWQAMAGCSPGTWIAEELPNLQDLAGATEPDSPV